MKSKARREARKSSMDLSPDHCVGMNGDIILSLLEIDHVEEVDRAVSSFLEESFDRWYENICTNTPCLPLPMAFGTAVEGGWSTKFQSSTDGPYTININVLQPFVFLKTLSASDYTRRVVQAPGRPGFVNIRLLTVDLDDSQSLRELAVMDPEDGEWYLSPKLTLELCAYHSHIARNMPFYAHVNEPPRTFLQTVLNDVYQPAQGNNKHLSMEDGYDFDTWDETPAIRLKIETVSCLECEGWPKSAAEWPRASAAWPDAEVVNMVKKAGFHLVRTGVDPKELALSWRLSFTRAENLLMKTWNVQQRRCYLALRAFCISSLSTRGGIGPYVLKTIMLWDCEEYPPGDDIWDTKIGMCMDRLLMKLRNVIERGKCNHYFIKKVDIIGGITETSKRSLLKSFDNAVDAAETLIAPISSEGLEKVLGLAEFYAFKKDRTPRIQTEDFEKKEESRDKQTAPPRECVSSIFTDQLLESTYETYVRVNMSTSKQDKARAARCRSKFFHTLIALYVLVLATAYVLTAFSPHTSLMIFLLFLVAGLLLNLGWSYRWSLCFIYAVASFESEWSPSWKVVHFVVAFPLAKLIAQMMGMFERPLEKPRPAQSKSPFPLTSTSVAKPGLVAPMLFLYGVNLLLMCATRAHGLRNYWDVFVCTLANQGHFMVFCPWMEVFYREYNQLVVRLKPAIAATVCTSLFVMFMLHCGDYNRAFWPWACMTLLVLGLCCSMCSALPTSLSVSIYVLFGVLLVLPVRVLYTVTVVLYVIHWIPWSSSAISRAIQTLTLLCVHLCLQTTCLTAILASVNMVFGSCMYVGCLYSFYTAAPESNGGAGGGPQRYASRHTSLLHRVSSRLMVLIFVGGVALLTLHSKPVSTQEAFIMVSAPVAAAMLLHKLEGTLLHALVKMWKRAWAHDAGTANHT